MSAPTLPFATVLTLCRNAGLTLALTSDGQGFTAKPSEKRTPTLDAQLRAHKPAILAHLHGTTTQNYPHPTPPDLSPASSTLSTATVDSPPVPCMEPPCTAPGTHLVGEAMWFCAGHRDQATAEYAASKERYECDLAQIIAASDCFCGAPATHLDAFGDLACEGCDSDAFVAPGARRMEAVGV